MEFRKDINGLRAIAVIVVVLFHFNVVGFSGGFIGVDIFFVISGFLMTKIINSRIQENNFSIINFYLARGRRIIPPLAILSILVMVFGWFTLAPIEYKTLSKHVVSSITFLSNFIYQKEAGYFDLDSSYKLLLHTWSLSAEWQFYLIYPLVFILFKRHIFKAILCLTAFSFALSIYYSYNNPSISYFLVHCRAWEMLAGAIVYFLKEKQSEQIKSYFWLGLALITLGLIFVDKSTAWPGVLALLPVVGTALIIYSNVQDSPLFNNKPTMYIGRSSYSIYLWHWPVFAFMNIYGVSWNFAAITFGIGLSLLLGFLSYELVEKKIDIRHKKYKGVAVFAVITMLVSTPALAVYFKSGIQQRVSNEVVKAEVFTKLRNEYNQKCLLKSGLEIANCYIGRKNQHEDPSVIIIGDSHSDASLTAVISSLPKENNGVLFLGYQNCLPIQDVKVHSETEGFACGEYNKKVFEFLKNNHTKSTVLIINRTSAYIYGTKEGDPDINSKPLAWFNERPSYVSNQYLTEFGNKYRKTLCSFNNGERQVYTAYPMHGFSYDVPKKISRDLMQNKQIKKLSIDRSAYEKRNQFVKSQIDKASLDCGVKVLDIAKVFCDKDKCYGNDGINSYYYDGTHLNEYGNKKLIPLFREMFS